MNDTEIKLTELFSAERFAAPDVVNVDIPLIKWVIFLVDDAWYAFPGAAVREILADPQVFFLPGCPASLEGVMSVRGDIESVLSLNHILVPRAACAPLPHSRVLLGHAGSITSGIRVDKVEDVIDLPENLMQDAPHSLPSHLEKIALGLIPYKDHLVTVLDMKRIFEDYFQGLL
jgi:purine-binding chemotaxis protein CheW